MGKSRSKYDVYIAAPFFNSEQLTIVEEIERELYHHGLSYYSPRLHSGSHLLLPEERKQFDKWRPVLESNINSIETSEVMLAVVEYAMPNEHHLYAGRLASVDVEDDNDDNGHTITYKELKHLELPDNGVVFECGYAYCFGVPIFGFHRTKHPDEMNLMLSHTMQGLITGFRGLEMFCRNWDRMEFMNDGSVFIHSDYRAWATPNSEVI